MADTDPMTVPERPPFRVLIVDDHPLVRSGLRTILETEDDLVVVGEAGTVLAAGGALQRLHPDVVLLDLGLPDTRGAATVSRLCAVAEDVYVLVVSAHGDAKLVRECLAAGASGFVLKTAPPEQLCTALRRVASGDKAVDPDLLIDLVREEAKPALTPRELEVLQLVSEGLTNRQVGSRLGVSDETVKTHLSHAMDKLGASDRTHAIALLLRSGVLL